MNGTLVVKQLNDNIWAFNESVEDANLENSIEQKTKFSAGKVRPQMDAYLVIGTERALVIDTLQDETSLYKTVKSLTSLPIEVLITHGHIDHAGVSLNDFFDAGCTVYLNKADLALAEKLGFDKNRFTNLDEGMVFDIGGYRLETILLPGHTPGSAVFLEREKQHLYTGDAIGAGVFWMWLPYCLPLHELQKNLDRLWQEVKNMHDLEIFTGHRHQAPRHDLEFLADVIHVTDGIISGGIIGKETLMEFAGMKVKSRVASYKTITDYCYNPENI
jgi:glyoxylase-like metal-dependent hydrolase (beta-lactamase superfamily II)